MSIGPKIKFSIPFHFVVYKIHLEDKIPNLVSKFKSDDILPLFVARNGRKLTKFPILPVFDRSLANTGEGVKCYQIGGGECNLVWALGALCCTISLSYVFNVHGMEQVSS